MASKILNFIGKGQVTIPQEWRGLLGIENTAFKATLEDNRIVLEPIDVEETSWDVSHITLNDLSKVDQKIVTEGRKAYKAGKKEKFLSSSEFFSK